MKSFSKPFLALLVLVVTVFGPVACGASEAVVAQKSASPVTALKTAGALSISTTALPQGVDRNMYLAVVEATGGTPGYTWSISSGNLPSGLTLIPTTGLITGTPKQPGTSTFTLAVSDKGKPSQTVTKTFSITTLVPLAITTSAFSSPITESTYTTTLQASGGTAPYIWSISSGSLPSGLKLDSTSGKIAGTPGVSGTSTFSVTVVDHGNLVQNTTKTFLITTIARLAVTTSVLASPVTGFAYKVSLQDTGGVAPYSWSISSGSLPAGLALNASTGVISGTPTASGISNFVATVTDSGNPIQTASLAQSISTIGQLSVPSAALPTGTSGVAYAAKMQVSGGVPAYTWSVVSGSLPGGLSLAATTGIVSGTPSVSGTFSFATRVVDNGSPTQAITLRSSIKINPAPAATPAITAAGTTWYIRADGGTRYSTYATEGQCDGKADAAYSGVGTNQHCAFNDYRFLWDDQHQYGVTQWVIAGGDTVIIDSTKPWRVGFDQSGSNDPWCFGGSGPYGCTNPTVPAGTPAQHTRILGRNYASCSVNNQPDKTKLTQIFGGHAVGSVLNLVGAQYVDVQCLDLSDHTQCMVHGLPYYGGHCNNSFPLDDFASEGISTNSQTHDLLLQDLNIHGVEDSGIIGPIGGLVMATRVTIGFNGMSGWNMDNGSSDRPPATALLQTDYLTVIGNGCVEEYPIVHTNFPANICYDQNSAGYGDGFGTAAGFGMSFVFNHALFAYNTQDGIDVGHVDTGSSNTLIITNSIGYGNEGQPFKWGGNFIQATFTNNLVEANCRRMADPIDGASSNYNQYLSLWCRAGDALSFNFIDGSHDVMEDNTIVTYAPTTFDVQCWTTSGCSTAVWDFKNNAIRGYDNFNNRNNGSQQGGPGLFYMPETIGTVNRVNNVYYGIRGNCLANVPNNAGTGTLIGENCLDPQFVGEPVSYNGSENILDNYNFTASSVSPLRQGGVVLPAVVTDYYGKTRSVTPTIGAIE